MRKNVIDFFKSYLWVPTFISLVVYFQILSFGTAWEDDSFVIQPLTRSFELSISSFYKTIPGSHFFPLSLFQCYLINLLFSYPFGFHLYALVLHIISSILATIIVYKITNSKILSIIIVSLWTVHPVNVETITRIVCAPAHVPAGAFCLAYLLCFLNLIETNNKLSKSLYFIGSILFFLASITFYEQYILFPFLTILIFYLSDKSELFQKRKLIYYTIIPIVVVYLTYTLWRYFSCGGNLLYAGSEFITWTQTGGISDIFFRSFWLAPQLFVHYVKLFFIPVFMSESQAEWYKTGNSIFSLYSLSCQLCISLLIIIAFFLRKKVPVFSIGIFWFFLTLIPVIQIFPLFTIVDEHYCYLPLLGILLAIFSLANYFRRYINNKILVIFSIILFMALMWRTLVYLPTTRDRLTQLITRAQYSPSWTRPMYMIDALNEAYNSNKIHELPAWLNSENINSEIEKWLSANLNEKPGLALKFGPMQNPYKYNTYKYIGRYLYSRNRMSELETLINQALSAKYDSYSLYIIAELFAEFKDWQRAWLHIKQAVKFNPKFRYSYSPLFIVIALNANKFEESEILIKKYLKLDSKSSYPYLFAGLFYEKFNKTNNALKYFTSSISEEKPPSINYKEYYYVAFDLFVKNKKYNLAKKTLRVIESFDPFDEKVKEKLSKLN